jgi:hypothetical protein
LRTKRGPVVARTGGARSPRNAVDQVAFTVSSKEAGKVRKLLAELARRLTHPSQPTV